MTVVTGFIRTNDFNLLRLTSLHFSQQRRDSSDDNHKSAEATEGWARAPRARDRRSNDVHASHRRNIGDLDLDKRSESS